LKPAAIGFRELRWGHVYGAARSALFNDMNPTAMGFRAHTGWAVAVTIAGTRSSPVVIDRRRVNLLEKGVPWEVYHVASRQPFDKAKVMVEDAADSARRMACKAVDEITNELRDRGFELRSAGIVLGGRLADLPLEQALRAHAAKHAAEGQLYRDALLGAASEHKLQALGIPEKELEEHAASTLKVPVHELRQRLVDLGKGVGPPWAADQRHAALIAWLALVMKRRTP
jgi:hypothetical protein